MRHNRGCKCGYSQFLPNSNYKQQNVSGNFNQNFQRRRFQSQNSQNLEYISRCRCGYGPNAFYKTPQGTIIHSNQLNSSIPQNIPPQKTASSFPQILKEPSSNIEIYRTCNRCGSRVREDAYFCTECGNELGDLPWISKKDQIQSLKTQIKELKNQIKVVKKNSF
ncbi:MAG TPA: zinc-ribbon domain-containing protein [Candidatus Deferrimicrobium sp.]|nr:zinc-ribbon domain-containing protein [Candidatus Deferrimicrobium sp.]